jgi:hypothetical protein
MPDSDLNAALANAKQLEATLCLSSKVIVITEDQLELRIADGIQKMSTRDSWVAPLGISATLLVALLTAEFKNLTWVASETLKGFFIACTTLSCLWLVVSLFRISQFGRQEFMASIRAAGTPYSGAVGATTEQNVLQNNGSIPIAFQCRQCGKILPEPISGQKTRCPVCGTVS